MTPKEVNKYMEETMGFTPRMFKVINTVTPDLGKTFADFYATIFGRRTRRSTDGDPSVVLTGFSFFATDYPLAAIIIQK